MTDTETEAKVYELALDKTLMAKTIEGSILGLQMTGVTPIPVGASRCMSAKRGMTVLVGCHGDYTGTVTLNISEYAGLYLTGCMLGEEQTELNEDVLDAVGEIANMIAGGIKDLLIGTDFEFANISVPSVILGAQYELYHYRGFQTVMVEFEIEEIPVVHLTDRFFSVAISLMKR